MNTLGNAHTWEHDGGAGRDRQGGDKGGGRKKNIRYDRCLARTVKNKKPQEI